MECVYCYPKSALEHRFFELVSRLHELTSRLMSVAGRDHQSFIATKSDCDTVHSEIADMRRELQTHRAEHGG